MKSNDPQCYHHWWLSFFCAILRYYFADCKYVFRDYKFQVRGFRHTCEFSTPLQLGASNAQSGSTCIKPTTIKPCVRRISRCMASLRFARVAQATVFSTSIWLQNLFALSEVHQTARNWRRPAHGDCDRSATATAEILTEYPIAITTSNGCHELIQNQNLQCRHLPTRGTVSSIRFVQFNGVPQKLVHYSWCCFRGTTMTDKPMTSS